MFIWPLGDFRFFSFFSIARVLVHFGFMYMRESVAKFFFIKLLLPLRLCGDYAYYLVIIYDIYFSNINHPQIRLTNENRCFSTTTDKPPNPAVEPLGPDV